MIKFKLFAILTYFAIIGYNETLGIVPNLLLILHGITSGFLPSMIISLFQLGFGVYFIYTAFSVPYYKGEKLLFVVYLIISGITVLGYILAVPKMPGYTPLLSIVTIILYFVSLYLYGRIAYKKTGYLK